MGAGIQAPLRDVSSSAVSRQPLGLLGQLLPGSPLKLTLTVPATSNGLARLLSSMSKVSGDIGTARVLRGIIPTRLALATVTKMIYRRLLACESIYGLLCMFAGNPLQVHAYCCSLGSSRYFAVICTIRSKYARNPFMVTKLFGVFVLETWRYY